MRILALVPGGIADQLLFMPTLTDLQRSLPTAVVSVVVEPRAKGAYDLYRGIDAVIPFDFNVNSSPSDWSNLLGIIRDHAYDVVMSTRPSLAIGLLFWLTGTSVRISYRGGSGGVFFTSTVAVKSEQYTADRYHDLLQGLDINTPTPELTLTIAKRDLDWAQTQTTALGLDGSGYLLLYGGQQWATTTEVYPPAAWQTLINGVQQQQPQMPIVWIQDGKLSPNAAVLPPSPTDVNVIQPKTLGQLAAIVAGATVLLCPDTVPMYLGVGLGVYTVGLFGASDPQQQLPASDRAIGIKAATRNLADLAPAEVMSHLGAA